MTNRVRHRLTAIASASARGKRAPDFAGVCPLAVAARLHRAAVAPSGPFTRIVAASQLTPGIGRTHAAGKAGAEGPMPILAA